MSRILQINSSLYGTQGQSSQLASQLARSLGGEVTVRDLHADPLPHLDAATFGAFATPADKRSAEQQLAVARSDQLIDELRAADVVVLALPMYNFGVPSTLKAWIDHVARAGVTFRYTASGPVGLLTGKRVYVVATRGGVYAGTPRDTQTAYVRDFFAFLGMSDIEFVHVEELALGEEPRNASLARARAAIAALAPARPAARLAA